MNLKSLNKFRYTDREKSWLSFNERVLQEAADSSVPLLERLRFIGIFSNNLDEFFRVRYASIRRLTYSKNRNAKLNSGITAQDLITEIKEIVLQQQQLSFKILEEIEGNLNEEGIFILNETQLNKEQQEFVKDFFLHKISPILVTIVLSDLMEFPLLRDSLGYLAVRMQMKKVDNSKNTENEFRYAVIEIPNSINRFIEIPSEDGKKNIIFLDDIIRLNLHSVFGIFNYENISAHMIKITRDAELGFDSDFHKSFVERISTSVRDRSQGELVRFIYDKNMDVDTLNVLLKHLNIKGKDSIIPGGKYHNRRDYMDFPTLGRKDLVSKRNAQLPVKGLSFEGSIINKIQKRDYMINTPYQSFSYLVRFLREAALDLNVISIKITLYRLAKNSQIISSLINAAKNGKKVIVQIELQARFDEESNIFYAELMQTEGIQLIFGVRGLKVHSKICVIERVENKKIKFYGFISTGNFNESTANVYTDLTLLTSHSHILKEVNKIFDFLQINYRVYKYKHLLVSPHYTRSKLNKLIERETKNAIAGKEAYLKLKMNSLSDIKMIDRLYEASNAGVKIQLIVRGICCLIPGVPGMSENIEAISIVDKYLEHSRVYIFGNEGNPDVYISSADFMSRNLDERVEVSCPIYDEKIKKELLDYFEIGWSDNIKSRWHSEDLSNKYRRVGEGEFRSQIETYKYFKEKLK